MTGETMPEARGRIMAYLIDHGWNVGNVRQPFTGIHYPWAVPPGGAFTITFGVHRLYINGHELYIDIRNKDIQDFLSYIDEQCRMRGIQWRAPDEIIGPQLTDYDKGPVQGFRRVVTSCTCGILRNSDEHFDDCPEKGPYGVARARPIQARADVQLRDPRCTKEEGHVTDCVCRGIVL